MRISHSYTLLSSTRPTETRSIGFLASSVYGFCWRNWSEGEKQEDIMLSFSNADKNKETSIHLHRLELQRLTVELSLEQFCSVVRHFSQL